MTQAEHGDGAGTVSVTALAVACMVSITAVFAGVMVTAMLLSGPGDFLQHRYFRPAALVRRVSGFTRVRSRVRFKVSMHTALLLCMHTN